MRKKVFWIGLACALALAVAWFWPGNGRGDGDGGNARSGRGRHGASEAPPAVTVATAQRGEIDVVLSALGTVTARNTTVVKARVSGQLQRIAFQEGQRVKAGDLLAEIDPRPFQAQLDQAAGQLARDRALLANAKIDLARYRDLLAKNSIARQQVDTQAALVKQYEGAVQTDQGNAENARLQLSFTRITAPIDGRLGLRRVDAGNMVSASDADGIVTITQTQPIAVVFSVPAAHLGAVLEGMREHETLPVEAWDQDNKNRLAAGKLLSVDNQIDTATGTVRLKAEFTNADEALFPNQFVNIRLNVATRRGVVLIPAAAVLQGQQGDFAYIVDAADKTVSVRRLKIGVRTNETVSVDEGLTAGEAVVVEGVDNLRDGAKITLIAAQTASGDDRPGESAAAPAPRASRETGSSTADTPKSAKRAKNTNGAAQSSPGNLLKNAAESAPGNAPKSTPSAAAGNSHDSVPKSASGAAAVPRRPDRPGGLERARSGGSAAGSRE